MRALLDIYRLRHGAKISSLRLLFYVFFGHVAYLLATDTPSFSLVPVFINMLIVFCGLLYASVLNDYYDFLFLKEKNGIAMLLDRTRMMRKYIFLFMLVPLIVGLFFFFILRTYLVTTISLVLLWVTFLLSFLYCVPPVRLKDRPIVGIVVSQTGIFLLFLQAFLLFGYPNKAGWVIAFFVFLFEKYLDSLHSIDDLYSGDGRKHMSIERSFFILHAVTVLGVMAGILFGVLISPLFFVSTVAWALRFVALRNISAKEIVQARRNIFHPIWQLEDFVLYAVVGILHV